MPAPQLNRAACLILRYQHQDFLHEFTADGYIRIEDFLQKFREPKPEREVLMQMLRDNDRRFRLEEDPDKVMWVTPLLREANDFEIPVGLLPPLVGYVTPPHSRIAMYARQVQAEMLAEEQRWQYMEEQERLETIQRRNEA